MHADSKSAQKQKMVGIMTGPITAAVNMFTVAHTLLLRTTTTSSSPAAFFPWLAPFLPCAFSGSYQKERANTVR